MKRSLERAAPLLWIVPLALGSIAILALGMRGDSTVSAILRGSLTTAPGIEATLKSAVPLLLCGLAVALGFRAGIFNLGAEGQLVLGAIAATAIGTSWPGAAPRASALACVPLELLAGAVAGALWAAIACWLKRARGAPEVLTTILLNFVAIRLAAFLVDYGNPLNERSAAYPESDPIASAGVVGTIPLGSVFVPAGVVIALALAVGLDAFLFRTVRGLELRLFGTSPTVARAAGFSPARASWTAFLGGGALAGLAGALGIAGVTHRLFASVAEGAGYTAVAVALVAGLRPLAVAAAALGFAALEAGAQAAQREAGVPRALAGAAEGLVVLAVLAQAALTEILRARAERARAARETSS
jgi:simple sugar transport system permease protein